MDSGTMNWLNTRKPLAFLFFLIFVILASVFSVEGWLSNPFLPNPFRKRSSLRWELGEGTFNLPKVLPFSTNTVRVNCNVTSYDFVLGNPAIVTVQTDISIDWTYSIVSVEARPFAAIEYYPPFWNVSIQNPSRIYLHTASNATFSQTWRGSATVVFQAVGSLNLEIRVIVNPSMAAWEMMNWSTFNPEYATTIQFQSITIESGQSTQQETSQNLNLSLTYFVLFLASTEISIALYDHSEDKERSSQYHEEKARDEHSDEYGKYIA